MARILLGVSGSIAAYKAADLASRLKQAGHEVTALLTQAACQLISPHTFLNLTGNKCYTDIWDPSGQTEHIALTDRAELAVLAPATANLIAKLAHGLADDMVSTTLLAVACPVLVCPAMNTRMWQNRVVQDNVARLSALGHHVLLPSAGNLACGHVGPGRLPEPADIVAAVANLLGGESGLLRDTFLEIVTPSTTPTAALLAEEDRYRQASLARGELRHAGSLGEGRYAYLHLAADLPTVRARAEGSPLVRSGGAKLEIHPWGGHTGSIATSETR